MIDNFRELNTVFGVFQTHLIGPFGISDAQHAYIQTGAVHHSEHMAHALVFFANQITYTITIITKGHHTCGAGHDTQFMFNGYTSDIISLTQRTIFIHHEFRYNKQADAFCALWCIRQSRQYQMNDVVRTIMLTPGDENLLATDLI